MTVELGVLRKGPWRKYWPCFLAGVAGPLLGNVLARWLPFYFAVGIAFFAAWFFAGLILARRWPPRYGIPGWLASVLTGAAAGVTAGVLTYYIPWK